MIRFLVALSMALMPASATERQKATLSEAGVVRVEFVSRPHFAFPPSARNKVAAAMRTESGAKWVVINQDADLSDMDQWFRHEMAHHIAWQRHGEGIEAHGPEFQQICRDLVTRRQSYFCKGE